LSRLGGSQGPWSAPASIANLGPGFDCLGLALPLRARVAAVPAPSFSVVSSGSEGRLVSDSSGHPLARLARLVAGSDRFRFEVESEIPVGRGLGSSAAVLVAGAAALGADDPATAAASIEGHADNAAAAAFGGLVAAHWDGRRLSWVRLPLDPGLSVVAVVAPRAQSTEESRARLPRVVGFSKVVDNLASLAFLLAGLASRESFRPIAGEDRIVTPSRLAAWPPAGTLIELMRSAGACAAFLAGSGPSVAAIVESERASELAREVEAFLARESPQEPPPRAGGWDNGQASGSGARVLVLRAEARGLLPAGSLTT
jgi:homoserine kinase